MQRITKSKLLELLAQKAVVITPNNRLSNSLLREYYHFQKQNTLEKPVCMPYSTFIKQTYNKLSFHNPNQSHPILLNNEQVYHLWKKILKSQSSIPYSQGLLQSILEAWTNCQLWLIDPKEKAFGHNYQTQEFQQLWQLFNDYLDQNNFITEPQLIPYLLQNQSFYPKALIWVCFDDFTPQQLALQNHLKEQGQSQYCYDLQEKELHAKVLQAKDNEEEYQQVIAWLHLQLEQQKNPIGLVIPELQEHFHGLNRLLLNHFEAQSFDISLGRSFGEFPLIAHALIWLHFDCKTLNAEQLRLLLQSPYLGFAKEEFLTRAHFLENTRLLQKSTFTFKQVLTELKSQVPKLASVLSEIKAYPAQASLQTWVLLFQERLNEFGFPGDYGLNSENYQCHTRLKTLFDEFRQLSLISPQLELHEALEALSELISHTIFQPQKKAAPIQISGLLEASGHNFESLWVMGLTSHCLPSKTRLSAFIPPALQRKLLMPHSLPSRELAFAKLTLERLQHGSKEAIFSYPALTADVPNLASPLIIPYPSYARLPLLEKTKIEAIVEEESYQVALNPKESITGGSALLANQAKCPFKAFAQHRLKAKASQDAVEGLSPLERGQLIHKVMELLWQRLQNQKTLLAMSLEDLDALIHQSILKALQSIEDTAFGLIQEVEYTRIRRLVLASLEWEKKREPFEVEALEEAYSISLAGLDFKVRIDRLDRVSEDKWVIDYKSNLPYAKPWNEDRPREPQLLLYALLDESIRALVFMQLKTGEVLYNGLSETPQEISGISPLKKENTWEGQKNNWHSKLLLLAEEFKQGHCLPNPLDPLICQQCDFKSLCRFQAIAK